jgi:HD-GYP domain-containing protein (c-di-GMP phosphodiesterase class II)
MVKQHAETGYEILKGIPFFWPIADMVRQHHERIDGSGYPHGLKGQQIILEAKIIAVADTVEAIASHRPYRAAIGLEAALINIKEGRDTLFDASVADACFHLFYELKFEIQI